MRELLNLKIGNNILLVCTYIQTIECLRGYKNDGNNNKKIEINKEKKRKPCKYSPAICSQYVKSWGTEARMRGKRSWFAMIRCGEKFGAHAHAGIKVLRWRDSGAFVIPSSEPVAVIIDSDWSAAWLLWCNFRNKSDSRISTDLIFRNANVTVQCGVKLL